MNRKIRRIAAAAVTLLAAVFLVAIPAGPASAYTQGTVRCTNGLAIQGIWVEAQDPAKRGWANRWVIGGDSSVNGWSHGPLNPGDYYQIHVGCGSWSPTYKSDMKNNHSGDFLCHVYWYGAKCIQS